MRGTISPGGADWQYVRADDVTVVEARYLLRTDDDVLLEVHNAYESRHGPAETMKRLAPKGENVDQGEYWLSEQHPCSPRLPVSTDWLN